MTRATRRRCSSQRGFTLLEVAIATALTGVLMVMVLQWVGDLARSGALGGVQRQAERDAQWVYTNLSRDAASAGPCDTDGLKPVLASLGATDLGLFVDADADGVRDLVTWNVQNETVTRSVQVATKPCQFATEKTSVVMTDMVRTGTTAVFQPIAAGALVPIQEVATDCLSKTAACATDGAAWVGARVAFVLAKPDGTPLAKLDNAFTWSRQ